MIFDNLILLTDSYKVSHWKQYPPKTENVYSYFESRGGQFPETIFFGLQYQLMRYLEGKVITDDELEEAKTILEPHVGPNVFNYQGWEDLVHIYDGNLPLHIKAVPEGLPVPIGNVLMSVENTDTDFYWLTSYIETLLVQNWYPCNVATISYYIKKLILKYLKDTGDENLIDSSLIYKLHDFGCRASTSMESASIGSLANLLNFQGTDTVPGLKQGLEYYGGKKLALTIPAAEHSTIAAWGKEHEADAYKYIICDAYPEGYVSVVSDTYDIDNACTNIWGSELKDVVLNRKGTVVIRPDSGKLPDSVLNVLERLGLAFGTYPNNKSYKMLNNKVRVIQGDGVDYNSIKAILEAMKVNRWSADNIVFGMGGALLQKHDRDMQQFAYKCSNITVDGVDRPVFKSPKYAPEKASKAGKLKLVLVQGKNGPVYRTINTDVGFEKDVMIDVFHNGEILKKYTFDECRENTTKSIIKDI